MAPGLAQGYHPSPAHGLLQHVLAAAWIRQQWVRGTLIFEQPLPTPSRTPSSVTTHPLPPPHTHTFIRSPNSRQLALQPWARLQQLVPLQVRHKQAAPRITCVRQYAY